ncbi:MAG: HipA domain-containing protein [Bacteroidota bacterium]
MSVPNLTYCPGTLTAGHTTYSRTCLRRMFHNRLVHHVLPYPSPSNDQGDAPKFIDNQTRISISGVQEKFSVVLEKNKLRLSQAGETGHYILKPIPKVGKNTAFMPANEHLTMQIARQVYGIETAENALIFFQDGEAAYLTKRFDVRENGTKWASEDFASLAKRTPQTHGTHFKYLGSYDELFGLMKQYLPAYVVEAPKLWSLLIFNYLFSNGDAHFKNFSLLQTELGDFRLSPAYDLLNTRVHIQDSDFALEGGLLPKSLAQGKVTAQFNVLAKRAGISDRIRDKAWQKMLSGQDKIKRLIEASYLSPSLQRNYLQAYQTRWNKLNKHLQES